MNMQPVKDFAKSKKGKTMIAGAIGAAVLYFFPGAAAEVGQWADVIAEILTGVADKVDPAAAATVVQP